MSMSKLEKVLAESLAKMTNVDILGIIAAAQESCGACETQAGDNVKVVVTTAEPTPKPAPVKRVKEQPQKPVETASVDPEPVKEKEKPTATVPADSVDLTGLFVGSGADKRVVKDVFLAAVEKSKTLAHLIALNAACDCGFATGDYTEETMPVLKRKLTRWGAAQE